MIHPPSVELFPEERLVDVRELLDALPEDASLDWWRAETRDGGRTYDGWESDREEFERDLQQLGLEGASTFATMPLCDVRHFTLELGGEQDLGYDVVIFNKEKTSYV